MMEVISPWDSRTMWTYSVIIGRRLLHRTGQLTTPSIWNQTSIYHVAESITFRKWGWIPSRPTSKQPYSKNSSSNHHPPWQHQSCLQRKKTAECGCLWTTELSMKPLWRIYTLSHWSRRCSTHCEEPGSWWNWTSTMPIALSESRKEIRTTLRSAVGMGSLSTESCCSGWQMHQLLSKPI